MPRNKPPRDTTQAPAAPVESPASANGPASAEVLTLAETAAYLRVPAADVLHQVSIQGLPGRKIGEEWRFFKGRLQTWLSSPPPRKGFLSQLGALADDPHREELLKD